MPSFRFDPEYRHHVDALAKLMEYANSREDGRWANGHDGVYGHAQKAIDAILVEQIGREETKLVRPNYGAGSSWLEDIEDAVQDLRDEAQQEAVWQATLEHGHPAHTDNGIAFIRCLKPDGTPAGYITKTNCYWESDETDMLSHVLRFSSFKVAEDFLAANPQWQPSRVESIDPSL